MTHSGGQNCLHFVSILFKANGNFKATIKLQSNLLPSPVEKSPQCCVFYERPQSKAFSVIRYFINNLLNNNPLYLPECVMQGA